MKLIKLFFLTTMLIWLASCSKEESAPTEQKSLNVEVGQYQPAKIGSYWKYEIVQNGVPQIIVGKVVGTKEFNGKTWVEYETEVNNNIQKSYARYDNGKYYAFIPDGTSSIIGDFELLSIDENAAIGDKWEIPATVKITGSTETMQSKYVIEVYDKLDSYEVKGKTYKNIIAMHLLLDVSFGGQDYFYVNQIYYYASGVGVIQSKIISEIKTITQDLIEYNP